MKLRVIIRNETKDRRGENLTRLFCRKIFRALAGEPEFRHLKKRSIVEFSVALVANRKSQRLNHTYRGVNRPTNVLSFALFAGVKDLKHSDHGVINLGDVVMAPAVIRAEAKAALTTFYSQFFWVLSHGILHILGFDHERSRAERLRMELLERQLQKRLRGSGR